MKSFVVIENEPRAKEAFALWDELSPERPVATWEEEARLIRPQRGGFGLSDHTDRELEKPLSSEPIIAQSGFAAGIYASITNPANRWGGLETPDKDFNNWKPMAEWNDIATNRVLASFRPPVSTFYSSTYQAYSDIAAFGNMAGYDHVDRYERKFVDVTLSLAEVCVVIDAHGRVVEVVRKFSLRPKAALAEFGADNLPGKILDMVNKGQRDKITFIQHVMKNTDFVKGKFGPGGKRWLSHTACEIEVSLVRVKGYDEMPFYYGRWDVDSGMTYGTGPGFIALASARTNQLMDAATIRAAQKGADPTLLAPGRDAYPLEGVVRPGEVIYGGVDMRGKPLVHPLNNVGAVGLTIEEKRAKIEAVKEAFHYSIMSLVGRTGVTPEESLIMEEARLRNWAPHADRIMEEYAGPKFERRFKQLVRLGQIPPPPKEAEGRPLQIRYQSSATMAMRAREGVAIRQFLNDLGPLAQMDARYGDRLDADAITEALHDASPSLPASILTSREHADALAKQRAEQQQQAQMMEAAKVGGGVMRDITPAMLAQQGGGA